MRHLHEYKDKLVIARPRLKEKMALVDEVIKANPGRIQMNQGMNEVLQTLQKIEFSDEISLYTLMNAIKWLEVQNLGLTRMKHFDWEAFRVEYEQHQYASDLLGFLNRTPEEAHQYLTGIAEALNMLGLLDLESEATAPPLHFRFVSPELRAEWELRE